MFNTDNGGDQVGCHNAVLTDTMYNLSSWYVRQWCILHQLALMVKSQLGAMSKHFGNIAKFIHVWRSPHTALKLRAAWEEKISPERAQIVCKKLPPKPLKGRWGAISLSEAHVLSCGHIETRLVLPEVLSKKSSSKKKKPRAATPAPLADKVVDAASSALAVADEHWLSLYQDDDDQYEQKNSLWIQQTLDNVVSDNFWAQTCLGTAILSVIKRDPDFATASARAPCRILSNTLP